MTRRRAIGSRTDEPSNESHKNKEGRLVRCYLLGAGSEPRSGRLSRGKLSVCTWRGHFWRVGTVLFRVRGTGRGESVSTGTDGTHFVREPVFGCIEYVSARAPNGAPTEISIDHDVSTFASLSRLCDTRAQHGRPTTLHERGKHATTRHQEGQIQRGQIAAANHRRKAKGTSTHRGGNKSDCMERGAGKFSIIPTLRL